MENAAKKMRLSYSLASIVVPVSVPANSGPNQTRRIEHFERISKIGQGTYGIVFKGVDTRTGKEVALKKIARDMDKEGIPSTALREIALLRSTNHPNVVQLLDVVITDTALYMVFEYLNMDLKKLLDSHKDIFVNDVVKNYMFQLLDAINYCHNNCILHRDLKPQNLLVDLNGYIKIADFGLARVFRVPMRAYTHEVVTLWYRAPEILMGCKFYSTPMDIWSLGCIFAEMVMKRPIFPGDSEIDQLLNIFRILGTPNESNWRGVTQLPDYRAMFPKWKKNYPKVLLDSEAFDLISKMLVYEPVCRLTGMHCLEHPYFNDRRLVNISELISKETA